MRLQGLLTFIISFCLFSGASAWAQEEGSVAAGEVPQVELTPEEQNLDLEVVPSSEEKDSPKEEQSIQAPDPAQDPNMRFSKGEKEDQGLESRWNSGRNHQRTFSTPIEAFDIFSQPRIPSSDE